uniref:Transmembrane protein n=1 Tax=Lactuca sativa TaxID=4236 RepID=A0A9R1W3E1_LACSA|nr:hypothetical protein LSAT_V11C300117080 [Lactuca sativa]
MSSFENRNYRFFDETASPISVVSGIGTTCATIIFALAVTCRPRTIRNRKGTACMIENRRSLAFLFCFGSYGASLRLQASSANKYWVEQVVKLADKERENLEESKSDMSENSCIDRLFVAYSDKMLNLMLIMSQL